MIQRDWIPFITKSICTYHAFKESQGQQQNKFSQTALRAAGCSGKIVFFTIHYNPSLAYIAVRDLQSSQRNAIVQSLLLASNFCTTNSSRVLARERWQTSENSWKKTQYLMNKIEYNHIWFLNIHILKPLRVHKIHSVGSEANESPRHLNTLFWDRYIR